MSEENTICFFDSGAGGLTVLKEFLIHPLGGKFFYYGDNTNSPYGNRSKSEIFFLTMRAFEEISSVSPTAVVVACNTVTAECINSLRDMFPFRIYGVQPAVRPAAARFDSILVLATRATSASENYLSLKESLSDKKIITFAPSDLAEDIERNILSLDRVSLERHLIKIKTQAVVLGCTHYSFLREKISSFYSAPVFDGGEGVFKKVSSDFDFSKKEENTLGFLGKSAKLNERALKLNFPSSLDFCRIL